MEVSSSTPLYVNNVIITESWYIKSIFIGHQNYLGNGMKSWQQIHSQCLYGWSTLILDRHFLVGSQSRIVKMPTRNVFLCWNSSYTTVIWAWNIFKYTIVWIASIFTIALLIIDPERIEQALLRVFVRVCFFLRDSGMFLQNTFIGYTSV